MYPFLLEPFYKDYIWGGDRLKQLFSKNTEIYPLAESWECSTHPDGKSRIKNGEYKGLTLDEIIKVNSEILGKKHQNSVFPILLKLIDAKENLSIQVHPDDEYAKENEKGSLGKFEMWYVLDAYENTSICYGLKHKTEKEVLQKAAVTGEIEKLVQKIKIKKDEVYFIEPGTIHSIGAGALIAEIQENSNLTYRLYDYKRKRAKSRSLQIDKALEVANLQGADEPVQPMRVLRYRPGVAKELICRCKYFEVHRVLMNTDEVQAVKFETDELSFRVLVFIEGNGCLNYSENSEKNMLEIKKGDSVFIPANCKDVFVRGKLQILDIGC